MISSMLQSKFKILLEIKEPYFEQLLLEYKVVNLGASDQPNLYTSVLVDTKSLQFKLSCTDSNFLTLLKYWSGLINIF